MRSTFAWCSFTFGFRSNKRVRQSDLAEGITRAEWLHSERKLDGEQREYEQRGYRERATILVSCPPRADFFRTLRPTAQSCSAKTYTHQCRQQLRCPRAT